MPASSNTKKETITLGINTSEIFLFDPKLLGFVSSKHKFVGKMVEGAEHVLGIGCMDGFGSAIVSNFVKNMMSIDFYRSHIEHIDPTQEPLFLSRVVNALKHDGVFIVGMPSLESQAYASEINTFSHINCQTATQLTSTLNRYFNNVFSFGMNDEVLHSGYGKMCHYILNLCVRPKKY